MGLLNIKDMYDKILNMKIKINKTVTEEIEISLPDYRESFPHFVKICNGYSVVVCDLVGHYQISQQNFINEDFLNGKEITEDVFAEAYNRVLSKITKLTW